MTGTPYESYVNMWSCRIEKKLKLVTPLVGSVSCSFIGSTRSPPTHPAGLERPLSTL